MELLEAFYRRKLRKKQKKAELGPSEGALCRSPSEANVSGLTAGIISRVLRFTTRRSEPPSRPHSWHSTKLGDGRLESTDHGGTDAMSGAWRQSYTASASDLSAGFDSGGGCLRRSPDQYSSRGSMESLDPPLSSQIHTGTQPHHHLGHHAHSGPHPAYSSCHQLSSARSSNSIDLLHNKRDSAYSSFSTSSSIPEYLSPAPSFSAERSYSLDTVPQRGGGGADVQQADARYFRTVYDTQHEQELGCTPRGGGAKAGPNRHLQGSVGGICYHGGSSMSNRHSVGPIWGPTASRSSYESLKGAPAPPRRSDSYAAIRNHERHERPNSWSSLDHARSLRSLQKGSWHHSSGSVSSGSAKASFSAEGQLHTVIEKSPESSPTTKPRQGGGAPQTPSPPSDQLILPTGLYPAPPPEPHYAHILSSGPASGASGVYPTLTRENHQQQHQGPQGFKGPQGSQGPQVRWDEAAAEGWRDGGVSAVENRYQSNASPQTSAPTSAKLRTQEVDRSPKDEADFGPYRPHQKAPVGGSEVQTNAQGLQNNAIHKNPGSQNQMLQEQIQEVHSTKIHPTHGLRPLSPQDWKDSHTAGESRHRSRSLDQPNVHPESSSRVAQGQVPPPRLLVHPQPQAPPPSAVHMSPCHHSFSAVPHQPPFDQTERDREHPLTRLEIALAEVQRCDGPFSATSTSSCHGNSSFADASQGPARSLSVLEKVSRFEHREQAVKQRSHSTKADHQRINEKSQNTSCRAEDLRNMLERSRNGSKAHRTRSYRGGTNHVTHRTSADPSSALQRSRSSFHLDASRVDDVNKDLPQKQDVQELMNMYDTSTHRSYQDSLKDAQFKVLHSTSPTCRDLDSLSSSSPPAAPPLASSSSSHQPPPVPTKFHSLEKKGPKTLPKPQGVIITSTSSPLVTSPHIPKERHVVSPEVRGPSPPALPSVLPVGPPPLMRICGRKRLMADQKKRSYSEPENMNEVGVSDADTAALFRRAGDMSVADRRKMFELAASCIGGGASHSGSSRTDLRQLQQDALFEYVERKRGARRDEVGTRRGPRPRSAYIQPEHANSRSDSTSLSTTSSWFSLQDCGPDQSLSSGDHRLCSTLPPGGDLRSFQSNLFYPGRVTSPRPPAHLPPSSPEVQVSSSQCFLDLSPEGLAGKRVSEPRLGSGLWQLDGALQRAGSARGPGKSASAEDLLERSDQRQISPQHCRSRSSPTTESLNQVVRTSLVSDSGLSGPSRPSGPFGPCPLDENRAVQASCDPGSAAVENCSDPGSVHPPVSRRDRQRTTERQRANSTSTLAASVGLVQGVGGAEWKASERLSQANLDAITFPGTGTRTSTTDVDGGQHASTSDSGKDSYRGRAFSLERRPECSDPVRPLSPPAEGAAPRPPSVQPRPSSLRISESALQTPLETGLNQVYSDEVFIPNPPSPSPIRETDIMEDLPPAPPPVGVDQEAPPQTDSSPSPCFHTSALPLPQPLPLSHPSSPLTPPPTSTQLPPADDLDLDYEPLPRRQKTPEELRVEHLARQLVLQDCSLGPLLDTWGGKSTMEVMEEFFPNSKIVGRSPWQRRGSSRLDERTHDGVAVGNENLEDQVQDQDQDQQNLNTRKVELCEALRSSVEALRSEKEALQEEVKAHGELGVHVDALVQQNCTGHQRDKYNMFIGDLERIVHLLLSLCGRMSRIDRCLQSLQMGGATQEGVAEERDCLLHKRSQLLRQTEDARELKENLERRRRTVHAFLTANLSEPQLLLYRRFIAAKPSLLIRQRRLDDLIRQGEEQLTCLADGLLELADAHGGSRVCPPSPALCSSLFPQLIPGPAHIVRSTTVTIL